MERTGNQALQRIYHSCVTWHIFNYFKSIVKVNTKVESPEFVTNLRVPIKWNLALLARRGNGKKYITECILKRSASCRRPSHIVVKVRLALLDSKGNLWTIVNSDFSFYPGSELVFRCCDIYDSVENILRSTLFVTGNITIMCEILQDIPLHFTQLGIDPELLALSNDLRVFCMIGNLTDLDLTVDGKTFSVHSAIVKARSPYIARILNENPSLQKIDLTGICSIPLIKGLIVYWYSGDLEKLPKIPCCSTAYNIWNMKQLELKPFVDPEFVEMETTFETSTRSIIWTIEDFKFCEYLRNLQRDLFYVYTCVDLPWKLYFYPKGIRGESDYFTLNIIEEDGVRFSAGYLEVFFKDENGTEYGCSSTRERLFKQRIHVFTKFMTHDEFSSLRGILLKNNILRIGCRIIYATGYVENNIEICHNFETLSLKKTHPYIHLVNEMKVLLKSEDLSDISLKSGERTFRVHSSILAARSRYFNELLTIREYDTVQSDEIILEDIEPEDLDMILKYMYYAEEIQLNLKLALRLHPVFHKYKITRLEKLCSDYLQNNLSVENAFGVIKQPNRFNDLSLKGIASRFILANCDKISMTETCHRLLNDNYKLSSAAM